MTYRYLLARANQVVFKRFKFLPLNDFKYCIRIDLALRLRQTANVKLKFASCQKSKKLV